MVAGVVILVGLLAAAAVALVVIGASQLQAKHALAQSLSNAGTVVVMAILFLLVIGIDVWLALDKKVGNTYSERIRAWGKIWPPFRLILSFGMGVLAGHWFWGSAK